MVDSKSIGGSSSRSLSSKLTSVVRPPPGRFSLISILSMCVKAAAMAGRWWNPPKRQGFGQSCSCPMVSGPARELPG